MEPESRPDATRVPVSAVRWVRNEPFVAVHQPEATEKKGQSWSWRKLKLGVSDAVHAEVLSGVKAGDRIVADPMALPEPTYVQEETPANKGLATASVEPASAQ